jgi:AraC family transcriptional regulator
MSKVLVLYYSSYGHIEAMANAVAEGARQAGAHVDIDVMAYVSRRRLESAKHSIAKGGASLSEIAVDCWFSSQSSFTRAFQRATGMTPAEYRQTLR